MVFRVIIVLLLFSYNIINAQEVRCVDCIQFQIDNDYFAPDDRDNYYTSGLFVSYSYSPNEFFCFKKQGGEVLLVSYSLAQQMFVPRYPNSWYIGNYDRPFAGWLGVQAEVSKVKENSVLLYGITLGVTGNASFSRQLQQRYHDLVGIEEDPLWLWQIPSEFMGNVKIGYGYFIVPKMILISEMVFGTRDDYLKMGLKYTINVKAKELYSIPDRKLYGVASVAYKRVFYDALIQGSVWNNDAPFTVGIESNMVTCTVGLGVRLGRFGVVFSENFYSKKTSLMEGHMYGTFQLNYFY
ncbi:hypothetical protein NBRC110019_06110 [Neptunitalea chrysea]|uniref:Lipid A deacylase LpxR family protein n=1 Tax=Neptunitalea chrysea TaxID=1647581 RepID=A0A9W6B4A6_9FLAO|nr:lipid A-modifier LpxR family protein [Neptunitalea chrysea]GLB51572.1 hypothetical protein NBRC110019_06110 [Neptunitalea chrysea]